MGANKTKKIILFSLLGIFISSTSIPSLVFAESWFNISRWFKSSKEYSLEQLVEDGLEHFAIGRYKDAIDNFNQVKDLYPFSKYSMLAELKIADAHYALAEYDQATAAYQEFENLHPQNEVIPYVQYQIGRCYFDQASTSDRDQGNTRKAMDVFQRLIQKYPESVYARRAQAHIKTCEKLISSHELDVGIFYYRTQKYDAAINRLEGVLANYPDVGIHAKALEFLVKSKEAKAKLEKKEVKSKKKSKK